MRNSLTIFLAVLLGGGLAWPVLAAHEVSHEHDRHAGYYYPPPQSRESYEARAITLPDSDRKRRLGFVIAMTAGMMGNNYAPPFAIFAKGKEAEKLIIVAVRDGVYNTLYRGRALFAMLTAVARTTPIFQEYGVEDVFTFFDLAKLLGFKKITISDGDTYSHQVFIK